MTTLHYRRVERRRTPRISVFADLTIQGLAENNQKFRVHTRSLSVSGFGGLTVMDIPVNVGQTLSVVNDNSREKVDCKVISIRSTEDGRNIVGFEFLTVPENFWKVSFPSPGEKRARRLPTPMPTTTV
jgi:c-di-GMP-binding flagellar brake protein YcgR